MINLIKKTALKISSIGKEIEKDFKNDYQLVFPTQFQPSKENEIRYSEQELRQCFIDSIKEDREFYYSVETPTEKKYSFTGSKLLSGNLDLCLYKLENNQLKRNICIEFKAHQIKTSYFNDLYKTTKEKGNNLYYHMLISSNNGSLTKLLDKLQADVKKIVNKQEFNADSLTIAILSLKPFLLIYQTILKDEINNININTRIENFDYSISKNVLKVINQHSWNVCKDLS